MDIITLSAFCLAMLCGFMAIISVLLRHQKTGDVSSVLIFSGVILIALPLASSFKLGKDGIEFQIRDQLLLMQAQANDKFEKSSGRGPASIATTKLAALVYYRDTAGSSARQLVDLLRSNGFLSSSTSTNFSELGIRRFSYSAGDAYITYLPEQAGEAERIKALMKERLGIANVTMTSADTLSANAIQIGIF